ncbi:DEKNAAC101754 [Brettanomyces naardenensis]|uniref:DEKNAAC101754 n=1 Tax=Brettanomyces naardenensis TaxID=13370 RepID=A0A448YIK7_BRENA|nr:DEKNAAC101754 [Brettanomyces naardenensis]
MSFDVETEDVYRKFRDYEFESNQEYQEGLEAVYQQYLILQGERDSSIKKDLDEGKLDSGKIKQDDKDQLATQAKVFFFCKQTGNILDLEDYKKWLDTTGGKTTEKPPYSSNYEQLVDMIVNNRPIPGIKTIPNTVLDATKASKHVLKERRKPWEADKVGEEEKEKVKDSTKEVKAESEKVKEEPKHFPLQDPENTPQDNTTI